MTESLQTLRVIQSQPVRESVADRLILSGVGKSRALLEQIRRETGDDIFRASGGAAISDTEFVQYIERDTDNTLFDSFLPHARRVEIAKQAIVDAPRRMTQKCATNQTLCSEDGSVNESRDVYRKAQWVSLAPTDPVELPNGESRSGAKVSFSFQKIPCTYRLGGHANSCTHCGLPDAMGKVDLANPPTSEEQLAALDDALNQVADNEGLIVFEIIPEGSFTDEKQIPWETQIGMMRRLSGERFMRIAIESRAKNCKPEIIKKYLAELREDQQLEIYLGLESTDGFVEGVVLNNGYGLPEFETMMKNLKSGLTEDELARVKISAYHLLKPPYLSDAEAVEDGIITAKKLAELSAQLGMKIKVKYEPGVITDGTLQQFLYKGGRYDPISYFSVAELMARMMEDGRDILFTVGARDDIDVFTEVPKVAGLESPELFSPYDFMVYNAVQRRNVAPDDVRGFVLDMAIPVLFSEEFKIWEKMFYGREGASALSRLVAEQDFSGLGEANRLEFQKTIWKICDVIEYSGEMQSFARIARSMEMSSDESRRYFSKKVSAFFEREGIEVFKVRNAIFVADSNPQAYLVEIVIFNEVGMPQSVWVKVPTASVAGVEMQRPDFIYGETLLK